MLKAVIFDMDGVIIDSEPLHAKAAVDVMKMFGVTINEEYCYSFVGSTDQHMFEVLIKEHHLINCIDELLLANRKKKEELLQESGYPLIPYVKQLIEILSKHHIPLAIASSSSMDGIMQTVRDHNLVPYFCSYVSGMDISQPKPAPDIFLKTCEQLQVHPSEAIVIEDSYFGVQAAKAAGIPCIGYYNPHSGKQDLSKADVIVEGFDEIDYDFVLKAYQRSRGEPVTITTTNRLVIRELTLNDIPKLIQIENEPEIKKFCHVEHNEDKSYEKHIAYIKEAYKLWGYGYWGLFLKKTNEFIGRCGIQNAQIEHRNEIELGYLIQTKHWNQGYAFEALQAIIEHAFYNLFITRIVAAISCDNTRSIHLAKKLGMKYEKSLVYQGEACDLYVLEHCNT